MEEKHGMPIMLNKQVVLIRAIRLRAHDGSYIIPHEDNKKVKLFKLPDRTMAIPKMTEWKIIWSGKDNICSFMSIHGKALTIRGPFSLTLPRLYLESWPVLDGAGDWKLKLQKESSDGKSFLAKLKPAMLLYSYGVGSLELGKFGVSVYGFGTFYTLVPSPGWKVEVVESSPVSQINSNAQRNNNDYEQKQQRDPHLMSRVNTHTFGVGENYMHQIIASRPLMPPPYVINNQGPLISNSQLVSGDYCNSGHNNNYSGSQKCGDSVLDC